jgi:short-subunit dehydrogenase
MSYRNKIVLLTGASSGIGYVTAKAFAQRGATVVAVARREPLLQNLIHECRAHSPESSYIAADLGHQVNAQGIVDETIKRHGRLDILINNAGISLHKQIYHIAIEEADRVMAVNFMSSMWTTMAAIPHLLNAGSGVIVNVSSFAAKVSPPREAVYAAAKAAMSAYSEGLWNDLRGSGIHVALIHPGPIDTEIWEQDHEPGGYEGRKFPPEIVADAIFEAIERKRFDMTIPKRYPPLVAARFLRLFLPSLLRFGMAKAEPIPEEVIEGAKARAARGKRLGDLGQD